jgi:RimJ/RimL family protein N-acetyltransferase
MDPLEYRSEQIRNIVLKKIIPIQLDEHKTTPTLFRTAEKKDMQKIIDMIAYETTEFFRFIPSDIQFQIQNYYQNFDLTKEYHINVLKCDMRDQVMNEQEAIATMSLAWANNRSQLHSAHISIMLSTQYQKRGMALAISQTLHEFIHLFPHLKRVTSLVVDGNDASLKLCQKMGFELEGTLKKAWEFNGEFRDLHVLGYLL